MAFTEDFTAFFNVQEFADNATLDGVAVRGIFDADYALQDVGGAVAASGPVFMLPSASVPALVVGKAFVHATITYKVVETLPDGTGVTTLRLRV